MKMFFLILIFALSPQARSNETVTQAPPELSMCHSEIAEFCRDQNGFAKIGECLAHHKKELSPSCQAGIERFIQAREQAAARGGGALTAFGGLNAFGPPLPIASYEGRINPKRESNAKTGAESDHKFNLSLPIYREGGTTAAVSAAATRIHIEDDLVLSTGRAVPHELSRYELGAQYRQELEEKKNWGLRTSLGYAGDAPEEIPKDLSYSVSASYGFPGSGKGYWLLMVFLANNTPLINYFPLPGFLYLYRTDDFTGVFGFPITSMQWTPIHPWAFSLSLFGANLQGEAAYGEAANVQSFIAYANSDQSFILSVREDERDRLTLHEQRIGFGARSIVFGSALLEAQVGHSFDRLIYIGRGFQNKDRGSASMDADLFASVGLKVAF